MADAQPADTQPAPDIGTLAGVSDKGTIADLTKVQQTKLAEDVKITREADARLARDQARAEKQLQTEGVTASELPKAWNATEEHKKFESNPIEGFGSVGGLFAMVASAFTKAPMQSAIDGMAGAIGAIQQNNEDAYARAHEAWKDNTKLALDRFRVQHDVYQDALSLMDHNITAGDAKLRNAAVRFGDSQTLMLAEHGMVKELFELQSARARAADQMQSLTEKTTEFDFKKSAIRAMQRGFQSTGDPNQDKIALATQALRILKGDGSIGSAESEAIGAYVMKTPASDPNFAAGLADLHQQFSPKAPNYQGYYAAVEKWSQEHQGQQIPAEEDAKLLAQFGLSGRLAAATGGGMPHSSQQIKAAAIQEIMDKHKAEGKPVSIAEAEHEYNATRAALTGGQQDTLRGKIDRIDMMEGTIDKVEELLKKHNAITGLGGKVTRPGEVVSNILGSNETDRKQFERYISELKEWAPRALTDSNGRPLAAEAGNVSNIIAGLQLGDTAANTARAYKELRDTLKVLKTKLGTRLSGGAQPAAATETATPTAKDQPWLNDPAAQ